MHEMKPGSMRQPFRSRAARTETKLRAFVLCGGGQDVLEIVAQRHGETGMRYAQIAKIGARNQVPRLSLQNPRTQEHDAIAEHIQQTKNFQYAQAVALDANRAAHTLEAGRLLVHRAGKACALGRYGCHESGGTTSNDCNPQW